MKNLGKVRHIWLVLIVLLATSLGAHAAVEPKLEDFYTYTETEIDGVSGYKLGLTPEFRAQLVAGSKGSFKGSNGYAWYPNCRAIPTPTLADGTYSNKYIIDMSELFKDLPNIVKLDLTCFDFSHVKKFDNMFENCGTGTKSGDVYVPKTVYALDADICEKLNTPEITGIDLSNLKFTPNAILTDFYDYFFDETTNGYKVSLKNELKEALNSDQVSYTGTNGYQLEISKENIWLPNPARNGLYEGKPVTDLSGLCEDISYPKGYCFHYFDTRNVTNLSNMFKGCASNYITGIRYWDVTQVENMSNMFKECVNITQMSFLEDKIPSVTDMSGMFEGCSALTYLSVSNFVPSHVTDLSRMFKDCSVLASIDISGIKIYNDTKCDNMFTNCGKDVESVLVKAKSKAAETAYSGSDGFDKDKIQFSVGSALESFYAYDYDSAKGGYKVSLTSGFKDALNQASGATFTDANDNVWHTGDAIPNPAVGGEYNDGTNGEKPVVDMSGLFEGCDKATNFKFADFFTENVTNMSSMFSGCSSLTSLNLGNFFVSKVTDMSNMFNGCTAIKTLKLDRFNVGDNVIVDGMFTNCGDAATGTAISYELFNTSEKTGIEATNMNFKQALNLADFYTYSATDPYLGLFSVSLTPDFKNALNANLGYKGWESGTPLPSPAVNGYCYNAASDRLAQVVSYNLLFYNCTTVTKLDLSEFDFEGATNLTSMLSACTNLTEVKFGNLNTSKVTSFNYVFKDCNLLSAVDVSKFNTSSAVNMYGMFYNCTSLKTLDISKFKTNNVVTTLGMFYKCNNLEKLDLRNLNLDNDTTMSSMFSGCVALKSIDFGNNKMPNMQNMYSAFAGCSSLESLDLSKFDTREVKNMGKIFYGLTLKTLDLRNFDTSKVTTMASMFQNCSNLRYLDLRNFDFNDNDNRKDINIKSMFSTCGITVNNKTSIVLVKDDDTKEKIQLKGTDGKFISGYSSSKLALYTAVDASKFYDIDGGKLLLTENFKTALNNKNDFEGWKVGEPLPAPAYNGKYNDTEVTSLNGLFSNCTATSLDLRSFDLPYVADMSSMFSGCSALSSVDMSSFNTSNVTDMSSMFSGCSALTALDFSSFNTENVTNMSSMFSGCSKLPSINVSYFDTEKVTDMSNMFNGCSLFTELDLSGFDLASGVILDGMFTNCGQSATGLAKNKEAANLFNNSKGIDLAKIEFIPAFTLSDFYTYTDVVDASSKVIGYKVALNKKFNGEFNKADGGHFTDANDNEWNTGDALPNPARNGIYNKLPVTSLSGMFSSCSEATSINLSEFDTSKVTDMSNMFSGCSSLSSISLNKLNTSLVTDMSNMFSGCSSLSSISLNKLNTSLVTNMSSMFSGCSSLSTIDVDRINTGKVINMSSMFSGCSALSTIDLIYTNKVITNLSSIFKDCTSLTSIDLTGFIAIKESTNVTNMFENCGTPNGEAPAIGYAYNATSTGIFNSAATSITPSKLKFEQAPVLTKFYSYSLYTDEELGSVYKVSLATPFKTQLNKAEGGVFDDGNGYVWNTGDALPNPARNGKYKGLKVCSMNSMFLNTAYIPSLDLRNFDTRNITNMESMFNGCASLTSINLSSFMTSNVTSMKNMFKGCNKLASLDLSNLDTHNVTSMSYMFDGIQATTLDVSNFDTSNVTDMSCMFIRCSKMSSLDLSNFDTSNVTTMANMFYGCTSLTSLDLSSFTLNDGISKSAMFINTGIALGGQPALGYAKDAATVTKFNTGTSINTGNLLFKVAPKLDDFYTYTLSNDGNSYKVSLKDNFKEQVNSATGNFTDTNESTWKAGEPLPNPAKYGMYNRKPVTDMSSMFSGVQAQKLDLRYYNTDNVTDMSDMFNGCRNILQLDLASFDIFDKEDGVTIRPKLDGMFTNCGKYVYGQGAAWGGAKDAATANVFNDNTITNINSKLLHFGDVATGTDAVKAESAMVVYGAEGEVVVKPTEATVVYVYDFAGNMVATMSVAGESHIAVPSGLYIVKTPTTTTKVMVK